MWSPPKTELHENERPKRHRLKMSNLLSHSIGKPIVFKLPAIQFYRPPRRCHPKMSRRGRHCCSPEGLQGVAGRKDLTRYWGIFPLRSDSGLNAILSVSGGRSSRAGHRVFERYAVLGFPGRFFNPEDFAAHRTVPEDHWLISQGPIRLSRWSRCPSGQTRSTRMPNRFQAG